jgi:hypothetical protein
VAAKTQAAFRALKIRDRTRVFGYLRRGEAPQDPALAEAAIQYGEGILRSRTLRVFNRAFMVLLLAGSTFLAVQHASEGWTARAAFDMAVTLGFIALLARSPIFWPQRVRESLAATTSHLQGTGSDGG